MKTLLTYPTSKALLTIKHKIHHSVEAIEIHRKSDKASIKTSMKAIYLFSKYFRACETKEALIIVEVLVLTTLSPVVIGTSVIC